MSTEGYDPFEERPHKEATTIATLTHIIKGSFGTGILAMPEAFANAGLLLGLISTVLIGSLSAYVIILLVGVQNTICRMKKVPYLAYPDAMATALNEGPVVLHKFSNISRYTVDLFLVANQVGICCVYVVFVASNLKELCDHYWVNLALRTHVVIVIWPIALLFTIRDLKKLTPLSHFFNFVTMASLVCVQYYVFRETPTFDDVHIVAAPIEKYPIFVGICLFSLEAIGVILALESRMTKPGDFNKVIIIALSVVVFMYSTVGFFGYLKYGHKTMGSITLNLPSDETFASCIKLFFSSCMLYSYSLQGFVPVHIILDNYIVTDNFTTMQYAVFEYMVRFCTVVFTFIAAIVVPHVGLLASLVGALTLSTVGFIFPSLMEFCTKWPNNYGKFNYIIIKDFLIMLFGVFALFVGTVTSIHGIVNLP